MAEPRMCTSNNRSSGEPVGSKRTEEEIAHDRLSSGAFVLLSNHVAAVQEYMEDYVPEAKTARTSHASALQALESIRQVLTHVSRGKPISGTEFNQIVNESHAVFVKAGLLSEDGGGTSTHEYITPAWCIRKLYDGMHDLGRIASALRED